MIKNDLARDRNKLILKTDHVSLLKKREDELLEDMQTQQYGGHAEIRRQTAEGVQSVAVGLKSEITRLEDDHQQVVSSFAEAMNEIYNLRWTCAGLDEWTGEEGPEEADDLSMVPG